MDVRPAPLLTVPRRSCEDPGDGALTRREECRGQGPGSRDASVWTEGPMAPARTGAAPPCRRPPHPHPSSHHVRLGHCLPQPGRGGQAGEQWPHRWGWGGGRGGAPGRPQAGPEPPGKAPLAKSIECLWGKTMKNPQCPRRAHRGPAVFDFVKSMSLNVTGAARAGAPEPSTVRGPQGGAGRDSHRQPRPSAGARPLTTTRACL